MSLLSADVMAWVGTTITFRSDPITLSEARRFAAASGDMGPPFPAPEDAGRAEPDGTIVPPMLYYGATRPFAAAHAFAEDGTVTEHRPFIGTGQTMGGTLDIEWLRDIVIGDALTGVRTLVSLTEKTGRVRTFVVARWVTEYFDRDGALTVRETYDQLLF